MTRHVITDRKNQTWSNRTRIVAERSGARRLNPKRTDPVTTTTPASAFTVQATPELQHNLVTMSDPQDVADAILDYCMTAGKLFNRIYSNFDAPALKPNEIYTLDEMANSAIAVNACTSVSLSLMQRYPSVLGTIRVKHMELPNVTSGPLANGIYRHDACTLGPANPNANPGDHRKGAGEEFGPGFRKTQPDAPSDITVIDFTLAQFRPDLPFPWVGTPAAWVEAIDNAIQT